MAVQAAPGFDLQPSAQKTALESNYITNFNFLNQYLPDTYEKEGRLHTKYTNCTLAGGGPGVATAATVTINDVFDPTLVTGATTPAIRIGQTVMLSDNVGGSALTNKGVVTAVNVGGNPLDVTIAFYEATQNVPNGGVGCTLFIYGSEFVKGDTGMVGSLESDDNFFSNKPIILKDTYQVSGSDMAQIGWVEITSENGATGYLWYLKSEHDTR